MKVLSNLKEPMKSFGKIQYLRFEEASKSYLGYFEWDANEAIPLANMSIGDPFCFKGKMVKINNYSIIRNSILKYTNSLNVSLYASVIKKPYINDALIFKLLEEIGVSFSFRHHYLNEFNKMLNNKDEKSIFDLINRPIVMHSEYFDVETFVREHQFDKFIFQFMDKIGAIHLENIEAINIENILSKNKFLPEFDVLMRSNFFKTRFTPNFFQPNFYQFHHHPEEYFYILHDLSRNPFTTIRNLVYDLEERKREQLLNRLKDWLKNTKQKINDLFKLPNYEPKFKKEMEERAKWIEFEDVTEVNIKDMGAQRIIYCTSREPCEFSDECQYFHI